MLQKGVVISESLLNVRMYAHNLLQVQLFFWIQS